MHTDLITDGDGQLTQVGPDPLDYVLRYAAGDYDCYHQGRYIGSRATLPKRSRPSGMNRRRPRDIHLMDEPTTTLTIQTNGQTITARAAGQVALDLRALPRGATIHATLHDAPPDCPQIIAFTLIP